MMAMTTRQFDEREPAARGMWSVHRVGLGFGVGGHRPLEITWPSLIRQMRIQLVASIEY